MAGSYYRESRNVELSTLEYLETQIDASWTNVSVVKSFTSAYKEAMPVVAISLSDVSNKRREIGSLTFHNDYTMSIDIFGKSWGQTTDLADFVMAQINEGWVYNEYAQDSAVSTELSKTANGRVYVSRFLNNSKIEFGEDVDKYDKYRWNIEVQVKRSQA